MRIRTHACAEAKGEGPWPSPRYCSSVSSGAKCAASEGVALRYRGPRQSRGPDIYVSSSARLYRPVPRAWCTHGTLLEYFCSRHAESPTGKVGAHRRMDAFLDAFHVYPGHAVPQHLLRIHGSHRYEYAATLDECAQMCWAHAECAGFVDNRAVHEVGNRPLCIFKSSAAGMTARASKDFYARKSVYEAADHRYVRTPLQLSGFAAPSSSTRHDADAPPVLFTVDNVVSAEEAAQLREAGCRCFSSTPSTASRPSDTDEDDSRVPANLLSSSYFGEEYGCLAGAASPLLSSVERRIASLVGIPPHSEENPLMITAARPHTGRYHVRNLHHDKNNGPERVATVLIYLSNVTDDSHGGHTSFPALLRTDPEARLRTPRGERSGADGHKALVQR